jgi:hypothetical protein
MWRYVFYALAALAILIVAALIPFVPSVAWALVVVVPLIALGLSTWPLRTTC